MQRKNQEGWIKTGCSLPILLALITGCAGNSMNAPAKQEVSSACVSSADVSASAQSVPLLITSDAPLGPLLAFELQIDSVTLTDSCGKTVSLLSQPLTVEWTHVNGASEPLLIASVPQGTYTSAAVTYENPNIAYLWPSKLNFVSNEVTTGVMTGQVTLPSEIVVNGTATSIVLDTLLTQPVTTNSTINTVTPAFQVTQQQVAPNPTIDTNGKEGLRGLVVSAGSNQVVVMNQAGVSLTIAVGNGTQYQGVTGLATLAAGTPVDLDVATQADGSLLATRVQVENAGASGAWVGPLVVTNPQGVSEEVVPRQLENKENVSKSYDNFPSYFALTGGTQYEMYGGAVDLVDLPFVPSFGSFNDTALGQGLSVSYATQQQSASQPLTQAQTTTLIPRALSGTITAIKDSGSSVNYTITLASNDLLTVMSGIHTVAAYTNDGTQMETSSSLTVGSAVNMHGLLFNDGGTLRMVCDQVRLQVAAGGN
jgi:hypothetical protein